MIAARVPYTPPQAPASYSPTWLRTQLANLARAISMNTVRTITSADTVTVLDDLILVNALSGAVSVTLLPAAECQFLKVCIKKIDSSGNVVTIVGTVDGAVNPTLATQWKAKTVESDGIAYYTIATV